MMKVNGRLMAELVYPGILGLDGQGLSPLGKYCLEIVMARVRKYEQGAKIRTMGQLSNEIESGNYVFWWNKPQHPGWMASMTFGTLQWALERGAIRKANITKEWSNK